MKQIKRLGIMQPYFLPYIGYFQLINSVDAFVIYDNIQYNKESWINRNRILLNGKEHTFTIPLKEASQNKLINEIEIIRDGKWQGKLLKTIEMSYRKAPFFDFAFPIIEKVVISDEPLLSRFILNSMLLVNQYLGIDTPLKESSAIAKDLALKGQDRILDICMKEKASEYINAIGGMELYSKELFSKNTIRLHFIRSKAIEYGQFGAEFVPWLSIIDVMMFNDAGRVKKFLNEYELI